MSDIVSIQKRSEIMSHVKGKNSGPEIIVRQYLHANGIRFRLHSNVIPGHPDISIKKYKLAIFINGCFWHRHIDCKFAYNPKSNTQFWLTKFENTVRRDIDVHRVLHDNGWRTIIVWECELKNDRKATLGNLLVMIRKTISIQKSLE